MKYDWQPSRTNNNIYRNKGQTAWAVSQVTHNVVLGGMGVVLKCYVKE
mgnify:CR=1 FL=1